LFLRLSHTLGAHRLDNDALDYFEDYFGTTSGSEYFFTTASTKKFSDPL
jgi:hypothetical protein